MEALTRKNEKEKLAELEAMLADATLSGDVTGEHFCGTTPVVIVTLRSSCP